MEIIFVRHGQSTANLASQTNKKYDPNNIELTDLGIQQAIKTGKYISKTFGSFDLVFQSPLKRCVQTASYICKELSYDGSIMTDNLLIESGSLYSKLDGMSKTEIDEFIGNNEKLTNLHNKMTQEKNSFKKKKISRQYGKMLDKYTEWTPSLLAMKKNVAMFLKKMKELNLKRVLVVAHGGTLNAVQRLVTKTDIYNQDIEIVDKHYTVWSTDQVDKTGGTNCSIVGVLMTKSLKFELVISFNNLHLKD